MYSIAICDDDERLCFFLENILLEYSSKTRKAIKTEVFFSGEELYKHLIGHTYFDLIFLDIEMKKLNGIEVGLRVRNEIKNKTIQIIYISSFEKYAIELFKIRPMNFLIKPFKEQDIVEAIETSFDLLNQQISTFTYKIKQETYIVPLNEILYFNSNDREVEIHLCDRVECFYGTMESVANELYECNFIRVHRSYLVNYTKIKTFIKDKLILINDESLPISRIRQKEMREAGFLFQHKQRKA